MTVADNQASGGAGARFAVNVVGMVGLVFGALPVAKYLFDLPIFDFTIAPYGWLRLEGAARLLPPAMVLVASLVVAWLLERRMSDA